MYRVSQLQCQESKKMNQAYIFVIFIFVFELPRIFMAVNFMAVKFDCKCT